MLKKKKKSLNEENKMFTNYLSLFFFLSSLAFSLYCHTFIYIYKPRFDVESAQNCNTCLCFLIQMYKNICLDSLLVRQLKHMGFICNALNCLNKENKRFLNCLFLSLYLIFFSSSLALCLIVLMKKTKSSQIIYLFSVYIRGEF
jgi:preprotein translocase subunit SecG